MPAQRLIGTEPNQVPLNQMLGRMAFVDPDAVPPLTGTTFSGTTFSGASNLSSGTYGLSNGAESAPALYFAGDVDLGMYRDSGTGAWGFVFGGLTQLQITDAVAPLKERYASALYPVVTEADIGPDPDEISLNGMLGLLAFENEVGTLRPASSVPVYALDINFEYVSDTSLKIRMRGADGTVRSVTLTLA